MTRDLLVERRRSNAAVDEREVFADNMPKVAIAAKTAKASPSRGPSCGGESPVRDIGTHSH